MKKEIIIKDWKEATRGEKTPTKNKIIKNNSYKKVGKIENFNNRYRD